MAKPVDVKPHFRAGKPVVGHKRIVDTKAGDARRTKGAAPDSLMDLASEAHVSTISGRTFGSEDHPYKDTTKYVAADAGGLYDENGNVYRRVENCVFNGAVFDGMDLSGVEFVGCTFNWSAFNDLELSGATFTDCTFDETHFSGGRFTEPQEENGQGEEGKRLLFWENVSFDGCRFTSGGLYNAQFRFGGFTDCQFEDIEIGRSSHLNDMVIKGCSFKRGVLGGADVTGSSFQGCEFDKTKLLFTKIEFNKGSWVMDYGKAMNFEIVDSDLRECFVKSSLMGARIADSRIDKGIWANMVCKEIRFDNVTVEGTCFESCDLSGAAFSNSQFRDVVGTDLSLQGATWDNTRFDVDVENKHRASLYDKVTFEDAARNLGISDRRFEFLVLSGALEVRDNRTSKKVTSGFDPDKHHVPPWVLASVRNFAIENEKG